MNFVVSVVCIAHVVNCPIPNGYHATYQVKDKQVCEKMARDIIGNLGFATADFVIVCREK
jgi:hypothetical protein